MEVIVQDIKPEVSCISSTENSNTTVSTIGPKYVITTNSVQGTPATNNNTIRILTQNQKLNPGTAVSTVQTPIFVTSTGGIQGASGVGGSGTVYITGGSSAGAVTPSPVRTSTTVFAVGQQQLQTMAKSPGLSIVHVTLPQSVIQSPSVIQSASGQLQLAKGNVILLSKPSNSSVIQTTGGAIQTVQVLNSPHHLHSDESLSNDGVDTVGRSSVDRKRREILTRRPSYRKILNDLGGAEITGDKGDSSPTSDSSQDPLDHSSSGNITIGGTQYPQSVVKVINANTLGLSGTTTADATGSTATALQTITMTNAGTAGGTIVQYAQSQDGQQFFVPVGGELQAYTIRPVSSASSSPSVVMHGSSGHHPPEEVTRKREIRLLKNREAARECRRKKKEYIKCLENRVAVLENQNKALIDELKSLKELYCQQKTE